MSYGQTQFVLGDYYALPSSANNVATQQQISSAFDVVALEMGIPFKYPQAGCESRAYAMGLMLDSMQIPNFRVWAFAPASFSLKDKTKLTITDWRDHNNVISWNFHTAPILFRDNNGQVDTVVIDPALYPNAPVSLKAWLHKMGNYKTCRYTIIPNDFFHFNYDYNAELITGFYRYVDGTYDRMDCEINIALDYVGRHIYRKYLRQDSLQQSNLRPIITEYNNLRRFILSNELPSEISMRQIMTQYPEFVTDCKNVYNRAFARWTKIISAYMRRRQ